MDLNKLAILISEFEGQKHECNIADIKEILNVLCKLEAQAIGERLTMGEYAYVILPSELIMRRGAVLLQKAKPNKKARAKK